MPINWVDGSAGGTPLSAANLAKLAVTADLGTPGTQTGDAARAAYGPGGGAEIWDRFAGYPNGALAKPKLGGPYTMYGAAVGAAAVPRVASGVLTYVPTSGGAGYALVPTQGSLRRIGAKFKFGSYTTNTGSVGLIGWAADFSTTFPSIPDSPCHFAIGPTSWAFGVWSGGTFTQLDGLSFSTPLTVGTVYTAEAYIDREASTAYLFLPDGNVRVVTHALIGSIATMQACWELYSQASTDTIASFVSTWADSTSDAATTRAVREVAAQGHIKAVTYAPASAGDVVAGTSMADMDAAHVILPGVVAPPSGKLLIEFTGFVHMTAPAWVLWAVASGATTLATWSVVGDDVQGQQYTGAVAVRQVVTVTPGQTFDLKMQQQCTVASTATLKLNGPYGYAATLVVTPLSA